MEKSWPATALRAMICRRRPPPAIRFRMLRMPVSEPSTAVPRMKVEPSTAVPPGPIHAARLLRAPAAQVNIEVREPVAAGLPEDFEKLPVLPFRRQRRIHVAEVQMAGSRPRLVADAVLRPARRIEAPHRAGGISHHRPVNAPRIAPQPERHADVAGADARQDLMRLLPGDHQPLIVVPRPERTPR